MRFRQTTWVDWIVGAWAAALVAAAVLALYPGWPAVGAWVQSDHAPAWVQAVGSIVAILAAIAIAAHQQDVQRRDRLRAETEKLAAVFAPALALTSEAAKEIRALYKLLRAPLNLDLLGFDVLASAPIEERVRVRAELLIDEARTLDPTRMPSVDSVLAVRKLHALVPQAAALLAKMKRGIVGTDFRTDMHFQRVVGQLDGLHADLKRELARLTPAE